MGFIILNFLFFCAILYYFYLWVLSLRIIFHISLFRQITASTIYWVHAKHYVPRHEFYVVFKNEFYYTRIAYWRSHLSIQKLEVLKRALSFTFQIYDKSEPCTDNYRFRVRIIPACEWRTKKIFWRILFGVELSH